MVITYVSGRMVRPITVRLTLAKPILYCQGVLIEKGEMVNSLYKSVERYIFIDLSLDFLSADVGSSNLSE